MRRLITGDCHGNFKGLKQALERSKFNYEEDLLISLGDLVDGHSESYEVVEELLKIKNLLLIKGNHDVWFHEFIKTGKHGAGWQQGAWATAESYIKASGKTVRNPETGELNITQDDIPQSHKDLFAKQVAYIRDEDNNLFIHGGFNRHSFLANQAENTFYWDRDLWSSALSFEHMSSVASGEKLKFKMIENFKEVFIGHTSTQFWNVDTPMRAANIWNIDTGGGWFGYITIMDIDTKEFWQSDNALSLYPDFKGRQ